jgi:RNA polymerase sigma factor (sigma-70 family)
MNRWEPALAGLVEVRGGALVRYATLLCGNRRDAEDLVQEALVKVFTVMRRSAAGLADVHAVDDMEAYVRRAILNLFLDGDRRSKRWLARRHLVAREYSTAGPELATSQQLDVAHALAGLPPRQRACVVLRFYADLSVREIADDLGVTTGTVKRHLHDANTHLALSLTSSIEGEPA